MSEKLRFRTVDEWPLLLVGPIVRRVTRTDAWVFIATKSPCSATLLVGQGALDHDQVADAVAPGVSLRAIGANLHVGLLHATLPNPAPGTTYSYDIQLIPAGSGAVVTRLHDLGLLGATTSDPQRKIEAHVPLGYHRDRLPSFITPPGDHMGLRLAQGSCRKPHGNEDGFEADALPILDEMIALAVGFREPVEDDPAAARFWTDVYDEPVLAEEFPPPELRQRPHQLILTGDQIYADDVAPGLLDAISDAATKLMGWYEDPPGTALGINGYLVSPGWRTRYLSLAGLKEIPVVEGDPDYSQSHLLTFGEWCAMYIFAWSDALWPRTADGTTVGLRDHSDRIKIAEILETVETYEDYITRYLPPLRYNQVHLALRLLKPVDEFEAGIDKKWEETKDIAVGYGATVPYVRRVLANVATYTMFDDHEVTDDWFVDRDVAERLLGLDPHSAHWWAKNVGPRILRNGLSAYAVFQHWGNVPDDFAGWDDPTSESVTTGTTGQRLLTMWKPAGPEARPLLAGPIQEFSLLGYLADGFPWWALVPMVTHSPAEVEQKLAELTDAWLLRAWTADPATEAAHSLLRIDSFPTTDDGAYPGDGDPADRDSFGRFRWDYAIAFDSHRLVALDTRTWRRFPTAATPIPSLGTTGPLDRGAATSATAAFLDDFASKWSATGVIVGERYGELLVAVGDLIEAVGTAIDDVLIHLGDVTHAFLEAIVVDVTVSADVGILVADLQAEVTGTATYDARFSLVSDDDKLWRAAAFVREVGNVVDMGPQTSGSEIAVRVYFALTSYLESIAGGSVRASVHQLHRLIYDAGNALIAGEHPAIDVDETSRNALLAVITDVTVAMNDAAATHDVHERSNLFFRDGAGYLAAELISKPAMEWMVTDALTAGDNVALETVILSPAPIFGHPMFELVQRALVIKATAEGKAGAEEWEFEAWTANPVGFDNLVVAAKALEHVVVLSGDVHYGYSTVNRVELRAENVDTTYIQLTSSSAKNSLGDTKGTAEATDLLFDSDGRLLLHQFSPAVLMRRAWDYFDPDGTGQSVPAGGRAPAASMPGWWLEDRVEKLNDSARKYHLDDLGLMIEEYRKVDSVFDMLAWMWRWFYAPAGRGLLYSIEKIPEFVVDAFEYARTAPARSFGAWVHEAMWAGINLLRDWEELQADPMQKIFGHYLYSRDVIMQQVADAYRAIGVDPYFGVQIETTALRDTRPDRMTQYGARLRFYPKPRNTYLYGHLQEVQVVGSANVGIVSFIAEPVANRLGIRHELVFYPDPSHPQALEEETGPPEPTEDDDEEMDPGDVLGWFQPRDDWMATVHQGWYSYPQECPDLVAPDGPVTS